MKDLSNWLFAVNRRIFQPVSFALKRRRRFKLFGIEDPSNLPIANIKFGKPLRRIPIGVAKKITQQLRYASNADKEISFFGWSGKGTIALIDLSSYNSVADYEREVNSKGGRTIGKLARKAEKMGYTTRPFCENRAPEINSILASKLVRSGGLVPWALIPRHAYGKRQVANQIKQLHPPQLYSEYWALTWGVFTPLPEGRLVALVQLVRAGNLVAATHFIGHGNYLNDGVMSLAHRNLMRWLYDKSVLRVSGVRYFSYGFAEHAGYGLADWKRRRLFMPTLIRVDAPSGWL